jgi:two-component system, chemotaxis family, sensor kinase CheA
LNAFIEQFLIEGHELIGQATQDLLALESQPGDSARLDSVFRAFHTLKGAAGIIDFAAMARSLHSAEDALSTVRSGADPVTPALIGNCLSTLDQVLQWLDVIETSGDLPPDADAGADAIIQRFTGTTGGTAEPLSDDASDAPWSDWPIAGNVAIRYSPDRECFFRGEDPLAILAEVPDLLAVRIITPAPWPQLDQYDPFACQLTFLALSGGTRQAVAAAMRPVIDQVEIVELGQPTPDLPPPCGEILEAQILMLAVPDTPNLAGRLASAARVAANVLRYAGRPAQADRIAEVLTAAQAANDAAPLIAAIRDILAGTSQQPLPDAIAGGADDAPVAQGMVARTLRVDVERIDALVRLTGELTVIKNAVGHVGRQAGAGVDPGQLADSLKDLHGLLDRSVTDLQHAVLNIRVLPLHHVFQRFPRLVRDLGLNLGKSIRLVIEGDDTEADKAIVESLFEPLLHVLRNAADHGLENPLSRLAAGKTEQGTIRLQAVRQGENVIIEVADDGRGIDVGRVRQAAAQRGIASSATLAETSDAEIVQMIFAPGFSTATDVTDLSGRGVGMDAARTAIERLGGRVGVDSRPGQGTTVRFTLPFALMITRVMTVEAGGQMFGIALDSMAETVRIDRERIMPVGAAHAFALRNRIVPLFDLAELVGISQSPPASAEAIVVVAVIGGDLAGLQVDRLGERMDVMLNPMDGLLQGTPGIAGTTLLGDGRVLIVLDLPELLR